MKIRLSRYGSFTIVGLGSLVVAISIIAATSGGADSSEQPAGAGGFDLT